MRAWNLPLADTLFGASLRFDADFPQASLALAQERSWAADISAEVGRLARRALDKASALSAEDKIHAAALNDLASKRWAVACARYDSLIKRDSLDFAGWYGLAQCSRWDDAVVADRNAPSGLRFRGSHQRAVAAVERAFDLLPSIDACCIARAAAVIRSFFPYAGSAKVRFGFGQVPDATVYGAYPELNADTLAFTPISIRFLNRPPPPTMPLAVRQQRNQFYAMASKRVALATGNADALELLGEAMELRGDAAAAETVHRARGLAANRSQALRLAVTEIWLRLKYALPSNEKEIVAVRTLADSLLVSAQDASGIDATRLASVAALVSNVDMAARLSERIDSQSAQLELPQDVMASAKAFVVRAVMGGPPDSLRALEARVTNGITNGVLPQHQTMMRAMWLARGSALAFHVYRSPAFKALDTTVALIGAEAAVMRGDKRRARDILMRAQQARANVPPANVTLDALYPEAWLLASLGDSSAALARIAPTLDALRSIPSEQLADAVIAGSLMQSMRLRQSLLTSAGDRRGGQEWARAVGILTNPAHASTSRLP